MTRAIVLAVDVETDPRRVFGALSTTEGHRAAVLPRGTGVMRAPGDPGSRS